MDAKSKARRDSVNRDVDLSSNSGQTKGSALALAKASLQNIHWSSITALRELVREAVLDSMEYSPKNGSS
jgi:hypothetical protein